MSMSITSVCVCVCVCVCPCPSLRHVSSSSEGANCFVDRLAEAGDSRATANGRAGIADGHSESTEVDQPITPLTAEGMSEHF